MKISLVGVAVVMTLAVPAVSAFAAPVVSYTPAVSYTWKVAAVPAGATQCAPIGASPSGAQYVVTCGSLPAERNTVVMKGASPRALADTVGSEKFPQIIPQRVSDSGWVYGVVGKKATVEDGGWRLARWTPAGVLQLAPATTETATHQDISKATTADTGAYAVAVNERGDAVVDYHEGLNLRSSAWMWFGDGRTAPVMPVNEGRWAEGIGIGADGSVVFNDRVTGQQAFDNPLPYRRTADGTVQALPGSKAPFTEVHTMSPSGQHLVGGGLQEEEGAATWVRWDAPSFAVAPQASLDPIPGMAFGVNDAGDFVTYNTVGRGASEVRIKDALTGPVPAGDIEARAILADGRILVGTQVSENNVGPVGWLVPVGS